MRDSVVMTAPDPPDRPHGARAVHAERDGPVTIVTIDRPEVRNAVDSATAVALREAFEAFEADETANVAVLTGAGGTFCAGADLSAVADRGPAPDPRPGPRADGADPYDPDQAGARRRRGPRRGRWPRAGPVVRPAGGGRGRGLRGVLPALRGAPCATWARSASPGSSGTPGPWT